ncbi:unnamed protein product [Didymodactylos carnosus]|uniref:Uncharacterized protein n=1 Tax=Didymodactylos carnosus TaxID=1234261 RepID=A0A813RLT6_9BILA|nr:unnamed protein product [Didymodactylos carnosus]CAF3567785.1 unnamed protein product [Didymodactylos carnosus]
MDPETAFNRLTYSKQTQSTQKKLEISNRRLNAQYQLQYNVLNRQRSEAYGFHKHREHLFRQHLTKLRFDIAKIQPYQEYQRKKSIFLKDGYPILTMSSDIPEDDTGLIPTCFSRIENQFRLMNFTTKTKQRLLCQAPSYKKQQQQEQQKQKQVQLQKKMNQNTTTPGDIQLCTKRIDYYQSRIPCIYCCRTQPKMLTTNPSDTLLTHISLLDDARQQKLRMWLKQQIQIEYDKYHSYDERKQILIQHFDHMKHEIDDPHSTLSVLAALTRTLLKLNDFKFNKHQFNSFLT